MNNLHIEFKLDTGNNVFIDLGTSNFIESSSLENIGEINNKDVFLLTNDTEIECVIKEDIEDILLENDDVRLHSLEYIQWLENKINELKSK